MLKFTLKRLLMMIPVLLGVMIIVFSLSFFMPGDPVASQLGNNYTQEEYEAKQAELGLDQPFLVQLGSYIWGVVTKFDLGTSYYTNRPVTDMLLERIPVTLRLGVLSCLFTVCFAIPLGVISAVKQYSPLDYVVTTLSIFLASMPGFFLALMAIIVFSQILGLLPASGLTTWKHYILPVICNGMMPVAAVTRMTRSSMLEVIRQDYVRTAQSKGMKKLAIIWKHCLKNALIPVITMIGGQFSMILGGSIFIESIFSIPGMGSLMVTAINNRDYPSIMGITLVISFFMSILLLIVDLMYAVVDPRIRAQFSGGAKSKRNKDKKEAAAV